MVCKVREIKPNELRIVLSLIKKLFPNANIEIDEDDIFYVAIFNGKIVGFLHITDTDDYIFLRGIGVHPQYQHSGHGSALLTKLDEISTVLSKKVYLKVKAFNPAVLLYEKFGFMMHRFGPTYTLVKKPNN
ncbi:MAG: GNAT family N-acetyltransferase [Candidatus Bilamarchaeaceae archaeon]